MPTLALAALIQAGHRPKNYSVGKDDALWVEVVRMRKAGLLVEYPGRSFKNCPTAYEFAVATYQTATHLKNMLSGLDERPLGLLATKDAKRSGERMEFRRDISLLTEARPALPILRSWLVRFSPFLHEMGAAPDQMIKELDQEIHRVGGLSTRIGQFDVPANHWAAKAVLSLRQLSLIDGYPDEKYRG